MRDTRDLVLRLHIVISRMSREGGNPDEMSTLGEAAAVLTLMDEDPKLKMQAPQVSDLDALRAAKLLLDEHGAQESWRILTARVIEEHLAGRVEHRAITQQVLSALHKLTRGPELDEARH